MATVKEEIERLQKKIEDGSMSPDEPVFVLRAQDRLAGAVVRSWIKLAIDARVHRDKVKDTLFFLEKMDSWEPKRLPD